MLGRAAHDDGSPPFAESFDVGRLSVLEAIARGEPLSTVLEQIVRLMERKEGTMSCSILLVDGGRLRHGAAPSLPCEYVQAIDGTAVGPDVGSFGTAAWRGELVVVEDIATDPLWERYRDAALAYGLAACWSTPIFSPANDVLGTFAMYYREPRRPSVEEIASVDAATHLAAIAILRDRDESERARLESLLRQAQKMQSLGTLAGGIAHDFNNILMAVAGNTSLAMRELPDAHPARACLENVDRAARRATELVRRILTFSRSEPPRCEVMQLKPLLEEVAGLLRSSLSSRIDIRLNVDETACIRADANQIHQVVMNLATNAAQATGPGGGRVEIELDTIEVDADKAGITADLTEGFYVRLAVKDEGCGMSAATVERIFDPFFTTKPAEEGTGLGLTVVQGIVKNHAGTLEVHSTLGRGTVVTAYFPAATGTPLEQSAAMTIDSPKLGRGEHILYLDDEEALVLLASRILQPLGYRVSGFSKARDALAAFALQPAEFDLVVTDLAMTEMSGLEFARAVRRARPDIPVIVTSGYVPSEDARAAKTIGINEVVLKPQPITELAHVLRRHLPDRRENRDGKHHLERERLR